MTTSNNLDSKRCSGCGENKPRTAFGNCRTNKDGLERYCRLCVSLRQAKRYQKRTEGQSPQKHGRKPQEKPQALAKVDADDAYKATGYLVVRGARLGGDDDGEPQFAFRKVGVGGRLAPGEVAISRFYWDDGKWRVTTRT